jgi:hypothetical protein
MLSRPYLIIYPNGIRIIPDTVWMHDSGGACFVDIGWDKPGGQPFHIIPGPVTKEPERWITADGVIIRGLTGDDPEVEQWVAWEFYKDSPEGQNCTDNRSWASAEEAGALPDSEPGE